jgi:galactose oxidase-like protein
MDGLAVVRPRHMREGTRRRLASPLALLVLLAAPASALLVPVAVPLPCDALAEAEAFGEPVAPLVCGRWAAIPALPAAREGLGAVLLPGLVLAHGGRDAAGIAQGELYGWSVGATQWVVRAPGPTRADAVFVADPQTQRAYLLGGRDATGQPNGEVWRYDVAADAWTLLAAPPGPGARYGSVGAWDPVRRVAWAYGGGAEGDADGEMWGYAPDANTWTHGANVPQARIYAAGAWDAGRDGFLLHAGLGNDDIEITDSWLYLPASDTWRVQQPGPVARARHAAAWWPSATNLLLFGGTSDGALRGDAWVFAPQDPALPFPTPPIAVWVPQTSQPEPLAGAAAVFDAEAGRAYVIGGRGATGAVAEGWSFEPGLAPGALL